MTAIKCIAVWVTQGVDLFPLAARINPENLVDRLVTDVEKPCRIPHRSLGEAKACRNSLQLRVVVDDFPKLRRERLKLKVIAFLPRKGQRETDQSHNMNRNCLSALHSKSSSFLWTVPALVASGLAVIK